MEQETKQKPWTGIAAGVLVLCLILSLALSDGGARAASAGAVLAPKVGETTFRQPGKVFCSDI